MNRDAGFTLVEALVSLFVFGLIASGAVLMLMQSVETQNRVSAAEQALRELQTTRALLSADLSQLALREVREADGTARPRFVGGDETTPLAFVRAAAEPDASGRAVTTLSFVQYRFVDGAIERLSRADLDAAAPEPAPARVLVRESEDAKFEFFDGATWRDTWGVGSAGASPPRAVALVFTSSRYGAVRIEAAVGTGY